MLTLQDAKNKFSAVVDAALAGHPQEVSRRGIPAVVVVSATEHAAGSRSNCKRRYNSSATTRLGVSANAQKGWRDNRRNNGARA